MGMDVYGKKPDPQPVNEQGERVGAYFRNNVWWWRPLADYCIEVAPEETEPCAYWQSNDGDGLNKKQSLALADKLQAEVESGRTAQYAKERREQLDAMPDLVCWICDGTGLRKDPPATGAGDQPCNGCQPEGHGWPLIKGTGKTRPPDCSYPFSVENVVQWIEFLRHCGGFEIC